MKNKRTVKKLFIYLFSSIFISIFFTSVYLFIPKKLEIIDDSIRDYMFSLRGDINQSNSVVIIDLDDKSLQEIGQWPWSRNIVSELLLKLTKNNPALIAMDMVFSEADRSSPSNLMKHSKINFPDNLENYDQILAQTLMQTPTILGYQFQFSDEKYIQQASPNIPAIFIEKNRQTFEKDYVLNANGTLLNLPIIQESAYSSGFFNNVPDESGIVRSVPLLVRYDNQLFPSLSLEVIRIAYNAKKVIVNYDSNGVTNIQLDNFFIPTDRYGRMYINYRGKEGTFKYISAVDIVKGSIKKEEIENKIILIGTSAAGLQDARAIPLEPIFPGVEIHANAIDNIISQDFIHKASWLDGLNIVHIILLSFIALFTLGFSPLRYIPIIAFSFIMIESYGLYTMLFDYGLILNLLFPLLVIIVCVIIALLINYFLEIKQGLFLKKKFANKVSLSVMNDLLNNENDILQSKSKQITVFFSDIRGFTTISESMQDPQKLIEFLNSYMTPMTEIIINNHGTIDKYIGDAIMAYWNAPIDIDNHEEKAVDCAIMQIEYLKKLNETFKQKQLPNINIGIGINTGIAVVGEMGSDKRSDYTVIGDTINLGSRLESLCKNYGAKIIISEFTKSSLNSEKYLIRNIDLVKVKGKNKPVEIFEILGFNNNFQENEMIEKFNNGVDYYRKSNFSEALNIFEDLNKKEESILIKTYIARCKNLIQTPPKDFDGVYTYLSK